MDRWGLINDTGGVTGVCLVKPGEGSKGWARVGEFGQPASVPTDYFMYHPTYAGIEEVTDENGQQLVKIPAFWVKTVRPQYGPYAGRPCWILSPEAREGFHLHPAFKSPAGDMECIYVGAFLATDETSGGVTKYGSTPNKPPKVSVNLENFQNRIAAMGAEYHMINVYELAVVQWLFLVEFCDPDSQALRGQGVTSQTLTVDDPSRPNYRGMVGLWAGTSQYFDGLTRNHSFDPDASTYLVVLMKNDGSREMILTDYTMPSSSNWVTEMHWGGGDSYDFGDIFYPEKFDADLGSFGDKYTTRVTTVAPFFGGSGNDEAKGLFHLNVGNVSGAFTNVGSRIVKDGALLSSIPEDKPVPSVSSRSVHVDASANTVTLYDVAKLSSSSVTGVLEIALPHVIWSSGYVKIFMHLYAHTGSGGVNIYISTTFGPSDWASIVNGESIPKTLTGISSRLRFGTSSNGRKHILLGDETTSWNSPRFHLREVTVSGATYTYFTDGQGWEMSMIPSFEGTVDKEIASISSVPDSVPYAGTTTGSANTYAISTPYITALTTGKAVAFKINVSSTGTSTLNWCETGAKTIKKANGANVTNLKSGGIYTLRYDGTNFCLQGEGGSGNATAAGLLDGMTASVDAGDITGTMPNNGAVSNTITTQNGQYAIPAGYHNGNGLVAAIFANLVAANVKNGVNIGGVTGNFASDANAAAAQILSGYSAYVGANKITGSMPNRAGDTAALSSAVSGTMLKLLASNGYRDGIDDNVTIADANFIAANILSGKSIFGLAGSAREAGFAEINTSKSFQVNYNNTYVSGSYTNTDSLVVTGLGFTPSWVRCTATITWSGGSATGVFSYGLYGAASFSYGQATLDIASVEFNSNGATISLSLRSSSGVNTYTASITQCMFAA